MSVQLSDDLLETTNRGVAALVLLELIPDWEFWTVIGWTRAEMAAILPLQNPLDDEKVVMASVAFGNLLGYPHRKMADVEFSMQRNVQQIRDANETLLALSYRDRNH